MDDAISCSKKAQPFIIVRNRKKVKIVDREERCHYSCRDIRYESTTMKYFISMESILRFNLVGQKTALFANVLLPTTDLTLKMEDGHFYRLSQIIYIFILHL